MQMLKNEKKRVIGKYSFYDRTHIQNYLEDMAAKGWMLEKITAFYWQFQRITPQNIHFSVNYFPTASEFDAMPSEELLTFQAFCDHAGWKFVTASAQMQIYCNVQEQPTPIETDAILEVETIHKAMKKNFLPSQIVLLLLGMIQMVLQFYIFQINPLSYLSTPSSLFGLLCWVMIILMSSVELFGYLCWHKKARYQAEKDGKFFETPSYRNILLSLSFIILGASLVWIATLHNRKMLWIVIMMFLALLGVLGLVRFLLRFMKRRGTSAKINRIVVMSTSIGAAVLLAFGIVLGVIQGINVGWLEEEERYDTYIYRGNEFRMYHDILPLTVEDLVHVQNQEYSSYWDGKETLLLGVQEGYQRPTLRSLEAPAIRYTIYEIKWNALYSFCVDELLHQYDDLYDADIPEIWKETFYEVDAIPWNANTVYQRYTGDAPSNHYIVCYEDMIVELVVDFTLDDMQKQTIGEKLAR